MIRKLALVALLAVAATACGGAMHPSPSAPVVQLPDGAGVDPLAMRVHLIDVGQGAATLLEFPCAAVLIDTGGEDDDEFHSTDHLMGYLDGFFKQRPDLHNTLAAVYLTHPHIDHTLGARSVFERFHVLNVITDGITHGSGGPEQTWLMSAAQRAGIGEFEVRAAEVPAGGVTNAIIDPVSCQQIDPKITVLWGAVVGGDVNWSKKDLENGNNHSVVVRVDLGKSSFLVMGDLEEAGIAALLAKHHHTGALDVDVLEVGHHGSYNATTVNLLAEVTPKVALISVGDPRRHEQHTAWQYGHPRHDAIRKLETFVTDKRPPRTVEVADGVRTFVDEQMDKAIYATGWDGNVVVELRADGTRSVKTDHDAGAPQSSR